MNLNKISEKVISINDNTKNTLLINIFINRHSRHYIYIYSYYNHKIFINYY